MANGILENIIKLFYFRNSNRSKDAVDEIYHLGDCK